MNQVIKKIKIDEISPEQGMAHIRDGITRLEAATLEQLQSSLVGLAETFVGTTVDCEEMTRYALVMEIVARTLEENQDAVSLGESLSPFQTN